MTSKKKKQFYEEEKEIKKELDQIKNGDLEDLDFDELEENGEYE
ncbi:MAG: hypothetical protein ACP5F1_01675 [Thermoplasmata archaeon]|nr:hypothetical protein [Thermoplasmata archaeon]